MLLSLDERRRGAIAALEQAQARRNAASKEIGQAKAKKDEARAQALMAEVAQLKDSIPDLEKTRRPWRRNSTRTLAQLPNLPADDVPDGADETANVERHKFGARRDYAFAAKQHFDLGEALRLMDFEAAAKLSGSRFVVLKKGLARMERALTQFMLDLHTSEHGYAEVSPPLLVRDDVMFGTAQLPKFEDDQFQALRTLELNERLSWQENGLGAAGTRSHVAHPHRRGAADQPGPRVDRRRGRAAAAASPPARLLPRRGGRSRQGHARHDPPAPVHQGRAGVDHDARSRAADEHERMLACAEEVLRRLDLHYRVVTLCTGDMGFASQKTYDIEVWLPGQGAYREISSCSNCGEFQARRMAARYRTREGRQIRPVHTLNGSGVAVGRALIAVMETYQQGNGSIAVPDVLQPYMGGIKAIE